jgi:hypothetical protein
MAIASKVPASGPLVSVDFIGLLESSNRALTENDQLRQLTVAQGHQIAAQTAQITALKEQIRSILEQQSSRDRVIGALHQRVTQLKMSQFQLAVLFQLNRGFGGMALAAPQLVLVGLVQRSWRTVLGSLSALGGWIVVTEGFREKMRELHQRVQQQREDLELAVQACRDGYPAFPTQFPEIEAALKETASIQRIESGTRSN